jgi:uracil DNA glycosylase
MFFESTTNLENQKQKENRKINPQEKTTMTSPHPLPVFSKTLFLPDEYSKSQSSIFKHMNLGCVAQTDQ